ncbi:hypothetical protein CHARACLAT_000204 [Characodon lateralis]|uniref:Uncharacterized protein n=1 Tax=Characodon lateralis TaxID=208331 RepID=A0ABU7CXI7_9TELE|nr:hypothetical protein [Characodon lateralis]
MMLWGSIFLTGKKQDLLLLCAITMQRDVKMMPAVLTLVANAGLRMGGRPTAVCDQPGCSVIKLNDTKTRVNNMLGVSKEGSAQMRFLTNVTPFKRNSTVFPSA